ncbi:MAG: hypothetical protein U0223_15060 [Nitrospira sp.]|nr:hypothetical protein [Nitrospira sp.]
MTSDIDKCYIDGCDEKEEVSPRGSGILILSPLLKPVYVNPRACRLLSDLAWVPPEMFSPISHIIALPPILVDFAGKILSALCQDGASSDHGYCQIWCLTERARNEVLIRGIGVPSENGVEELRIVLVLTEQDDHDG